jgi:hypothetical protein
MQQENDGWEKIIETPPSVIVHWPNVSLPLFPPMHSMPHVASASYMSCSIQIPRHYKFLPTVPRLEKGKQPTNSPSSKSSEASSIQSKQPPV